MWLSSYLGRNGALCCCSGVLFVMSKFASLLRACYEWKGKRKVGWNLGEIKAKKREREGVAESW